MAKELNTVVEIGETHLKLVQSKDSPQGKILTQLLFKELNDSSEEAIVKSLHDLIAENKLLVKEVICVLPRNQATVRMLKLPSQEISEIDSMVNLQIAKHTPYTREDVIVDYLIAGKDDEGNSLIMLVIVHQDVVTRYINIFKAAKLGLRQLTLSSQGICNLYLYYQNKLRLPISKEALVIFDIDKNNTEACFYYQGSLVFSRALQFGTQEITEEKVHSLLEELRLTLATYNKEKIFSPVRRAVLTSASQNLGILSDGMETELSLNVEIINPQTELLKEKGAKLPLKWIEGEISANAALGLALQKPQKPLNLLPHKLLDEHKELGKRKKLFSSSVLALVVLGLIFFSIFARIYKKSAYLNTLASSINKAEPTVNEIDQMIKKIELIKQRLNPAISPIDIIYDLYEMFPEGMSLSSFELDENGNISLQGTSLAMADVFSFQSRLEQSPRFKNVEVKFASKRNTRLGEVTDFKITCQAEKGSS